VADRALALEQFLALLNRVLHLEQKEQKENHDPASLLVFAAA
jgi:hypothetical protein